MEMAGALDESDKLELLRLARSTLESYLSAGTTPKYHTNRPALRSRAGAFVSLHCGDELRGCIGQLTPDREIYRVIQYCAVSAATEDMRFLPVTASELPQIDIEISVLTPFCRVASPDEIEVGKHGLYIVRGSNRGLLLPQVATHYGWDRDTFLAQTCRKAGIPEQAWRDPSTAIHTFEAQVFAEH